MSPKDYRLKSTKTFHCTHKKRNLPLRIFLGNMSKSGENCGFAHIY